MSKEEYAVEVENISKIYTLRNKNNQYKTDKKEFYALKDVSFKVKKGDVVGKLEVLDNGNVIKSEDLIIDEDVSKINYFKHLYNSFKNIISGNFI